MLAGASTTPIAILDSATQVGEEARGAVIVCASHAGTFAAALVAPWGIRGAILNDAGVGKDAAGVAGLRLLEELGVPAAAVSHESARIGDGRDTWEHGVLSHVNRGAERLGCKPGITAKEAVSLLSGSPVTAVQLLELDESRHAIATGPPAVWALDSASLARPGDVGAIVVTGSHGGLLGGEVASALKVDALAAVFNDAGGGRDGAGTSRLPALDARGIPAATVAAASARIGDGLSTYNDGVVSAVNRCAKIYGAQPGLAARAFVDLFCTLEGRPTT